MLKFRIVTPERVVFEEDIDQVTMMTRDGEITVLPNHVPLITILQPGELRYKKNGEEHHLAVSGGFAEVNADNALSLLADTAERADEIDLARAEVARAKAEKLMQEARNKEDVDFVALQSRMEKELNRLKVGNKYRKIKP
jgi:F-type H+-transporting ATPase subunit epsilon